MIFKIVKEVEDLQVSQLALEVLLLRPLPKKTPKIKS